LRFVFTPSLGLDYISNANPACSCVYICKFQFRPIHPPLGDFQVSWSQRSSAGSGPAAGLEVEGAEADDGPPVGVESRRSR
jgi:hypothetical protein